MTKRIAAAAAALTACAVLSSTAAAQAVGTNPPCSPRQAIIDRLANKYSETSVPIGMASNGDVLEVLAASEDGISWTIIVTMPKGMSCLLAAGKNFEMLQGATQVKGDPA
jgi:hypothetical protein